MSKTVFISRSMDEESLLSRNLQERGVELLALSLIRIQPKTFDPNIAHTDWVFFSSKNGVKHFFAQHPILNHQKFGAIGNATGDELSQYVEVDFMGNSNDTDEVAQQFVLHIKNCTVLFPQSDESLRSVQKFLEYQQSIDLICYKTTPQPRPLGFPDVLVFSSPSNVRSFFMTNQYMEYQRCIAFGPATASELHRNGVDSVCVLEEISDEILIHAINDAIQGSPPWS
ncbi:MAG: uroporphyrinogen-III synthase [Flavobacteriales bacterium]|nr:uroporphyrinogen-III synthase [Flavobacteriales bacterium]